VCVLCDKVSPSTSESLNLVNSSTAKAPADIPPEPVTDRLLPLTVDGSSEKSSHASRPGSITPTKQTLSSKSASDETDQRDIVARIYREELQKLATTAKTNGNLTEFVMYERELERLAQSSTVAPEPLPPVKSPTPRRRKDAHHSGGLKRSVPITADRNSVQTTILWQAVDRSPVVDRPQDLTTRSSHSWLQVDNGEINSQSQGDSIASCSAHSTLDGGTDSVTSPDLTFPSLNIQDSVEGATPVKMEDVDACPQPLSLKVDEDCSPLDLMRTIADSVSSKSQKKSSSTETSRYALPPITTEQLKNCSHLNTDEVVAAVRATLADYSISQRLFGEAVLGLSQASHVLLFLLVDCHGVTDCLATMSKGISRLSAQLITTQGVCMYTGTKLKQS